MLPHQVRPVPCESCGQNAGTEETHCPAIGPYPPAVYLLCGPCKAFSDELHGIAPVPARPWTVK